MANLVVDDVVDGRAKRADDPDHRGSVPGAFVQDDVDESIAAAVSDFSSAESRACTAPPGQPDALRRAVAEQIIT